MILLRVEQILRTGRVRKTHSTRLVLHSRGYNHDSSLNLQQVWDYPYSADNKATERMKTMNEYILSCCSTADLSEKHLNDREINYICFHFSIDGKEYKDDLGKSVPFDEFYARIAQGALTGTSQINISEYVDYFTPFLEQGKDIVHVCLSSGLSGTVNSARNAALIAKERFPERNIYIVDSLAASSGYGLLMDAAADKRDEGLTAEELAEWIDGNKLNVHHWFFSTDLTCYVRGGRVSKTAAVFGGILEICPLLNMDYKGSLIPQAKVRTKKRAIKEIAAKMEQYARDGENYSGKCYISHSACLDDARKVASLVEEKFKDLNGKVEINSIGTTIGSHTGPGTLALFFWGSERKK